MCDRIARLDKFPTRAAPRWAAVAARTLVRAGLAFALTAWLLPGCARMRNSPAARAESAAQFADAARAAQSRGDNRQAIRLFESAIRENPNDIEIRLALAGLLLEERNLQAAQDKTIELIAKSPDDARGHVLLAQVLYQQQEFEAAQESVQRALEIEPSHDAALLLTGDLHQAFGRTDLALESYYAILAVEPDHAESRLRIADLHIRMGHSGQATPLLRALVDGGQSCEQQREGARWLLGQCYARAERWEEAASTLREGMTNRDPSADDWYQVAYASYRAGDREHARQAVQTALALAPHNPPSNQLQRVLDSDE